MEIGDSNRIPGRSTRENRDKHRGLRAVSEEKRSRASEMRLLSPISVIGLLSAFLAVVALAGQGGGDPPAKKLVEYGWDRPEPAFVRDHVREMERRPFDGVVMRIPGHDLAFDRREWDEKALAPHGAALGEIAWERFTENFLILNATAEGGLDWFDDARWETIERNLRMLSRAAGEGRLAGFAFDPEPYGWSPWTYPSLGTGVSRSFSEVEAAVRRRGAQFLSALRSGVPDLTLLMLFGLGIFDRALDRPDPRGELPGRFYALLPAFVEGMLDAAEGSVRIVDGHEPSYYYGDEARFARARRAILDRAPSLLLPEYRGRYAATVEAGMAVYADYALALWKAENDFPPRHASPAERLLWLEHNVYHALRSADRYAWLWGEDLDWWRGRLPEGAEEAVRSAREKIAAGRPLGFELGEIVARAETAMEETAARREEPREARAGLLPRGAGPPRVDGKLRDRAWRRAAPLPELRKPTIAIDRKPKAATEARVLSGEKALYASFRCEEPDSRRLAPGARDRYGRPAVDEVEVRIEQPGGEEGTFHRFAVGAAEGASWTTGWPDGEVAVWGGVWRGAARVGRGEWTAEIEIPWGLVGGPPAPGSPWRATLCRKRAVPRETSCSDAVEVLSADGEPAEDAR